MSEIRFTVPSLPCAQPRQRHRVMAAGGRTFVKNYTPTKAPVNAYKASVQLACSNAHGGAPLTGPLQVWFTFVLPRPQNIPKRMGDCRMWHYKRPDCENIIKSTQDALTGLAWVDDAQVSRLYAEKVIAAADETPHVEIVIRPLTSV